MTLSPYRPRFAVTFATYRDTRSELILTHRDSRTCGRACIATPRSPRFYSNREPCLTQCEWDFLNSALHRWQELVLDHLTDHYGAGARHQPSCAATAPFIQLQGHTRELEAHRHDDDDENQNKMMECNNNEDTQVLCPARLKRFVLRRGRVQLRVSTMRKSDLVFCMSIGV